MYSIYNLHIYVYVYPLTIAVGNDLFNYIKSKQSIRLIDETLLYLLHVSSSEISEIEVDFAAFTHPQNSH